MKRQPSDKNKLLNMQQDRNFVLRSWKVFPELVRQAEQKQQLALYVLVTFVVVAIFVATLLVTVGILMILIRFGILPGNAVVWTDGVKLLLVLAGSCFIVGIALTFLLIRIPLNPVNRVVSAFNRLAMGDYSARIAFGKPLGDHPAVKEFCTSFNAMASELEKTEVLRSDFINNFSHEFKAPIASIAGFAELLKRSDLTEEQRNEYLAIIKEESLRLSHMATNVLNLNKIESQSILSDITHYNLSEQIRNCILLFEKQLDTRQLDLDLDFDEVACEGNEDLLKQVWINLLENAIKFTPVGGRIAVRIVPETLNQTVTVCVSNTGSEIPAEAREQIFRKFYQVDKSKNIQGNGIGLAIVSQVASLHHGNVWVDCQNGETAFYVCIPQTQLIQPYYKMKG